MREHKTEKEEPVPGAATLLGLFAQPGFAKSDDKVPEKKDDDVPNSTTASPERRPSSADSPQTEAYLHEAETPNETSRHPGDSPAGSTGHLMNLFGSAMDTTPKASSTFPRPVFDRQSTAPRSNISEQLRLENTPLLDKSDPRSYTGDSDTVRDDFPLLSVAEGKGTSMTPIQEAGYHQPSKVMVYSRMKEAFVTVFTEAVKPSTIIGKVPALYPTADLFLAPFLANLAVIVDQTLADDANVAKSENDTIFLATFGVLSAIGICFSGLLLLLASAFKLANLGSFLPFPVICGFFAAVGVLTWTLAVAVDTGGKHIGKILFSGDTQLLSHAIIHHIPGVGIAAAMKYLGPKNPSYVIMVSVLSIVMFYAVMFLMGVSLDEARHQGWFWTHEELVYKSSETVPIGFNKWAPPAPFGLLHEIVNGLVHWGAVYKGLSTSIAMGFLYLIRCSVHGTALKKNIPNLSRRSTKSDISRSPPKVLSSKPVKSRKFSEAVDIEAVMHNPATNKEETEEKTSQFVTAKPTNIMLKTILLPYGCSQFISAFVGGFAITPSIAASSMMFSLGADKVAPQIGSALLLVVFYLTDFQLVGYIPKPAFSSMLVLSFIDMIYTWFYKSYFKTKDKLEWLVVPLIVIAAFALDLLSAVFLGIAISTFIFVAAFFRSGVVKYVADGIVIHSTIERPFRSSDWLNENGDLIQVLVLQNYLFFGNASSVYNYIEVLFQGKTGVSQSGKEKRRPLYMILDLTLVTGMDTSTVGVFNDIKNLCSSNECKLFMAGMSRNIRTIFSLGGFIADTKGERSSRSLRFFQNLDAALGKAEDTLLAAEFEEKETASYTNRLRLLSEGENGFRTALRHIDEEHDENFSVGLLGLQPFTSLVELSPGDGLYGSSESPDRPERGLFFIECGVLKVERDTEATITRRDLHRPYSSSSSSVGGDAYNDSLTKIEATSLANYASLLNTERNSQTFRVARIGPGWVAGTLEYVSGMRRAGDHMAITDCRLHHLPYSRLQEIEQSDPSLVLSLYKLLSYLMARRQEATIGQLATLHSIMTSPAKVHSLKRRKGSQEA
eukprot:scaffold42_cov133-Cylindrotheca_fusiformis.AAC.4